MRTVAAWLGAAGVALGALGAHALKNAMAQGRITESQLSGFETGVKYHLLHVLAILFLSLVAERNRFVLWSYRLFLAGILLFSGSLYLLCTRSLLGAEWLTFLGPVTPIGGVCLIAGWCCLALSTAKKS